MFVTEGEFLSIYFGLSFFILSYIIGHVVFQLGSFLDKIIYDKVKGSYGYDNNLTYVKKIRTIKLVDRLSSAKAIYECALAEKKVKPLAEGKSLINFGI